MTQDRAIVENLETRRLLSAGAALVGSNLIVRGDALHANNITVGMTGDSQHVNVSIQYLFRGTPQNINKAFPADSVAAIKIRGGFRDDTIGVLPLPALAVPVTIDGAFGNDTITGGSEDDIIIGGFGNDSINAGDGNNIVRGGFGNDSITTGSGNDKINGNFGNDQINAGAGNDTSVGGAGNDVIDAGDGDDQVFGGPGNDNLGGGEGNDALWGGAGNDAITGGNGDDTLGGILGNNALTGGSGHDTFRVTSLAKNPTNDFNEAEDTLVIVKVEAKEPVV